MKEKCWKCDGKGLTCEITENGQYEIDVCHECNGTGEKQ